MPTLQPEPAHPGSGDPSKAVVLRLSKVSKSYPTGGGPIEVLRGVDLEVAEGSRCVIVGPSGSGKTTLLGLCAGLDRPTSGSVELLGQRLEALDEEALAALRVREVGFVFQSFQLMPSLTALENVLVPLELLGRRSVEKLAKESLERVGLGHRIHHYPSQLSGGEQQRVALARAFIHRPRILFADEPTGNLDAETSEPIVRSMLAMNEEVGTALVLITHDPELAARTGRVVKMHGGRIVTGSDAGAAV